MSTLTDADQARGLTEPEGDARDLAAKLADARRLAESAARTAARLTRERDEARAQVARVWALHQPQGASRGVFAAVGAICTECFDSYPCPTVTALGAPRG